MGRYNVDTEEIQKAAEKLKTVYRELDRASAKITRAYNLIFDLNSVQTRQCASEIKFYGGLYDSQWANVKHIEDTLVNICAGLHLTENRAKEMLSDDYELKENEIVLGDWAPAGETENELQGLLIDVAQAVIGKCGVNGTVISSVWKVSEDCNGLTILKAVNNTVNSMAKEIIERGTESIEETIKRGNFLDDLGEQIEDSISGFKVKDYGNTSLQNAEMTRCTTDWIGVFLDGAENFNNNMKEHDGDWGNSRVYEETVVETVLEWGMDEMVDAALTWAFTPLVGPAAPIVAKGAGVIVDWGMDLASEWIFGNDEGWVENVSDGIIDLAHTAHDNVQNMANTVKENIGKGIASMGKSLTTVWAM